MNKQADRLPGQFWFLLCLFNICMAGTGHLYAQSPYFADGYHGGIFGHYPEWQTGFMMDKLDENPGWRINLEIEPETFDSIQVKTPESYRKFARFLAGQDGKLVEFTNPTYSQPYCYNISGESLIRQFTYGIKKLRSHFPALQFNTYAVEEPCFTGALPQLLRLFGFRYAVLKNPDTCYGGYMAAYGGEVVNWIGPDGTQLITVPRYAAEKLEDNSTWQTAAWNNSSKYIDACRSAGIKNPAGMCYQDAGWKNGPWLGAPGKTDNTYILWTDYLDRIADRHTRIDWKLTQEDVRVSLMWGSQVLQKLAQEIRTTENKLVQTEKLLAIQRFSTGKEWPQDSLDEAWRGLLMSQHHDCWIVPYNHMGSTGKTWTENVGIYTSRSNRLCDSLVATAAVSDKQLSVYNSTGMPRSELVTFRPDEETARIPFILRNAAGRKVAYQTNTDGTISFHADVPALGYTSYYLEKGKNKTTGGIHTEWLPNGNLLLQSDLYTIEIDPQKGGTIASLYSRKDKREWIDPQKPYAFNELRGNFYEEGGFLSSTSEPARVTVINDGPLRADIRIDGRIGRHSFCQYLTVVQGDARLDCRLVIDWQGNPQIGEYKENSKWQEVRKAFYDDRYKLHLLFSVALADQQVDKNAPFDVCRSHLPNTFFNRWDSIKNNVILNWVDLYGKQADAALALFTDHTTSYLHGEEYPLGLTVQYAGTGLWSRNYTICGQTDIRYSLLPHRGTWSDTHLTAENARINEPLIVRNETAPAKTASLLQVSDKGLQISALYYEGNDLIIRLYNEGETGKKSLELFFPPKAVEEIDLNGKTVAAHSYLTAKEKSTLHIEMPRFGIKTFRVTY